MKLQSLQDDAVQIVCQAIGRQLYDLAEARGHGLISEEDFIAAVLQFEAKRVSPAGLVLTASNTRDDWTVFKVRPRGCSDTCAAFEFQPETGEFRQVGSR